MIFFAKQVPIDDPSGEVLYFPRIGLCLGGLSVLAVDKACAQ